MAVAGHNYYADRAPGWIAVGRGRRASGRRARGGARKAWHAPLRIAPYQTDEPLPSVTSPITEAFGATNTSPPTIGCVS